MSKVKIIAVSDPAWTGKNGGAGSPFICTDPQYIGRLGELTGGSIVEWETRRLLYQIVKFEDDTTLLFAPEQLQEVAE